MPALFEKYYIIKCYKMLVIFTYNDQHKVIFTKMTQYCYSPDWYDPTLFHSLKYGKTLWIISRIPIIRVIYQFYFGLFNPPSGFSNSPPSIYFWCKPPCSLSFEGQISLLHLLDGLLLGVVLCIVLKWDSKLNIDWWRDKSITLNKGA